MARKGILGQKWDFEGKWTWDRAFSKMGMGKGLLGINGRFWSKWCFGRMCQERDQGPK